MSTESASSAVDRASTPAADSATNMAALIHRTARRTRRCRSATAWTWQHSFMQCEVYSSRPATCASPRRRRSGAGPRGARVLDPPAGRVLRHALGMDFAFSPVEEAFRAELREWLGRELPAHRAEWPATDDE